MTNLTIVGYGNMAYAIIKALYEKYNITVIGRDDTKLSNIKNIFSNIKIENIKNYNIDNQNIILCVKPYALDDISSTLQGKAQNLISVLASTPITKLGAIKSNNYYRLMPNVGAKYASSISAIYGQNEQNKEELLKIFANMGQIVWADSENEIELVTALCSSSIAFLALIADALSDGIVKEGMSREKSHEYIKGLFSSFSALLQNDEYYSKIKDNVMSPGGTTASGYNALEKNNTRFAIMDAISQTCNKAKNNT